MSLSNIFSCWIPSWLRKEKHAFLLDMPDVVTNEILKNLDFVSIRKLRRVCHAFRDYIDCGKADSNLKSIDLQVGANKIFFQLLSPSSQSKKDIEFSNKEVDDFLRTALKHRKSLLNELCVRRKWQFDDVPTFEKLFDCFINVLESRNRLLRVESLTISVHGQDQLMHLLRHVDLKVLRRLTVFRLLKRGSSYENTVVLDLDILKDCENLENLLVERFPVCSPFGMLTHIPNLEVYMQTICCEDLLLYKHTLENSHVNAHSQIWFEQFPDKSRFLEAVGLAENDGQSFHVFPSKLSLTYDPNLKVMIFKLKHIS
ncbi:hypothetical protein GCK72_021431 [Caenorhabditis remanei]|uniref:F-box domain-containing protein n=1 Tax=Caenorhabditis remanei TaxID=31234 RepID=A0A6A5GJT8_CAERE|nr:hypothetical protein GCK72_021431 [Caenorhabditis remanei]KAF1754866.1 hypothetical protein GCK72_021431 [Caenorhabditis remanei]